jgi:hypothetical protein
VAFAIAKTLPSQNSTYVNIENITIFFASLPRVGTRAVAANKSLLSKKSNAWW